MSQKCLSWNGAAFRMSNQCDDGEIAKIDSEVDCYGIFVFDVVIDPLVG